MKMVIRRATRYFTTTISGSEVEVMHNGHGFIMSKTEWEELRRVMDEFYANANDNDVKKYNEDVKKELTAEMERENEEFKIPKEKKKYPGNVYFIEYVGQGIKIGASKNPKERLSQLRTASPHEINLIHVIKSDEQFVLEKKIHEYFKDKKMIGEWYNIKRSDIDKLKGVIF